MWAGIPDTQLIQEADLIVTAHYVGATSIKIHNKNDYLGVLQVKETLKGTQQEVVFIRLIPPTPKGLPQRSDVINFKINQQGLWILQATTQQGIYRINTPQAFIPEQQLKTRLPQLLPLIKK